jgi:RecA/RadA recombinase
MIEKLDMSKIVDKVRASFKDERLQKKISVGSDIKDLGPDDFIKLGEWWSVPTGLPGLGKGRIHIVGGSEDSGKTSMCIQVTKAALEQGFAVIYIESENKTTEKDFRSWGVDPDNIILIQSNIAEEMFELCFNSWDSIKELYPDVPLLIIIDSLGNVISKRDTEIDLTESSSMPGGKGKINRLGLTKLIAKANEDNTTLLVVSYSYDNMGSVGKTIAGGKALHLLSSLTYQTARKGWLERVEKGVKLRYGAEVIWKLQKNHLNKTNPGMKEILFKITSEGIAFSGGEKKPKVKVFLDEITKEMEDSDELDES